MVSEQAAELLAFTVLELNEVKGAGQDKFKSKIVDTHAPIIEMFNTDGEAVVFGITITHAPGFPAVKSICPAATLTD
jgi:hypothetical protein